MEEEIGLFTHAIDRYHVKKVGWKWGVFVGKAAYPTFSFWFKYDADIQAAYLAQAYADGFFVGQGGVR